MITKDYLKEREIINEKLKLDSPEKIETAFQYYRQRYLSEENRKDKIEGRANLMIASSAIVMALITVFLCSIIYLAPNIPLILIMIIWIAYFLIALFIFKSIYCAMSINKLKGYLEAMQDPFGINGGTQTDIANIRKSMAIDYCCLANRHSEVNDQREILLVTSQKTLRTAVIILILLCLSFVIDILYSNKICVKYMPKSMPWFNN